MALAVRTCNMYPGEELRAEIVPSSHGDRVGAKHWPSQAVKFSFGDHEVIVRSSLIDMLARQSIGRDSLQTALA